MPVVAVRARENGEPTLSDACIEEVDANIPLNDQKGGSMMGREEEDGRRHYMSV